MQKIISLKTEKREALYDITDKVKEILEKSKITEGLCNIYVRHTTAAIMIQENWDASVQTNVINFLKKQVPQGIWKHDEHDGNADAHIKSGIICPSETIPIMKGSLALGKWQNIFLCEFDGPREREIIVTLTKA